MNFIQKRIQQKKLEKELAFKRDCCFSIDILDDFIPELKRYITRFSNYKKDPFGYKSLVERFIGQLNIVDFQYFNFIWNLNLYQFEYETPYYQDKNEIKQKIDYMLKKKKEYRSEFENIYDTFKRVTKGVNFPSRNEILGLMRKAFDFDSSKYYNSDKYINKYKNQINL